jgi:DNA-binding CsgD family transcriptional regulator
VRSKTINADLVSAPVRLVNDDIDALIVALQMGAENLLTDKERLAFQLIVREGRSYADTARIMTIKYQTKFTRSTVQTKVNRAAKKIRAFCKGHLNYEI